ncbi:hypothetical protein BKG91_03445 [Rodentibacter caecimuris]|uniref:DUF2570 family protein n=1 Tax=Rodentibacter caecimuris TaxID=1796644 RepID=UPI00075163C6|nr:DUF2570 family protein [Rodentibacter heylii]AOF53701.1 hypothetical protein AC062_1609 [Pasteurellaceae bacterium NI1060]OOF75512.1 hypothetical protein BKG91_03445 [Rodentibacter heylii]
MFKRVESEIKLTALFLILGLCFWLRVQHNTISSLRAKNQTQAQTITQQSAVISKLELQAKENERLTLELSKQETESRNKANDVIKSISQQEKSSDAYNSNAPRSVIDFLRQE